MRVITNVVVSFIEVQESLSKQENWNILCIDGTNSHLVKYIANYFLIKKNILVLGRFRFSASSSSKDPPRSLKLELEVALDLRSLRFPQRDCMINGGSYDCCCVFIC